MNRKKQVWFQFIKTGDKQVLRNFQPVSLLPILVNEIRQIWVSTRLKK